MKKDKCEKLQNQTAEIKEKNKKKGRLKTEIINVCLTVVGAFLTAFSMYVFILPAKFAPGGVSGISAIIQSLSGFSAAYSLLIFNAPLVVLSFIFLSRKFAIKTTLAIALSSLFLTIFRATNFYCFDDASNRILASLAGGLITGAGLGILVKAGASSGGTDVISILIQKKTSSLSVSWLIFFMNLVVIAFAGIMYTTVAKMDLTNTITIMLYSFISVFLSSKAMEVILNGVSSAVKFEVITSHPLELSEAIMKHLNRGVTIINSHGGFSKAENNLVICVVTRRQIVPFRKLLKAIDPCAFATAVDTREVLGNGFKNK